MPTKSITVTPYDGALLSLNLLSDDPTILLGDMDSEIQGTLRDGNGTMSSDDDGLSLFNGDALTYVGSGTFEPGVTVAGLHVPTGAAVNVVVFTAGGQTFLHFPDDKPNFTGALVAALDISDAPHELFENPYRGTGFDDTYHGDFLNNEMTGSAGADILSGRDGEDYLSGGRGDDRLFGGRDDDALHGSKGNDFLRGGTGNDRLVGGMGNDVMRGDFGRDTFVYHDGRDRILDFEDDADSIVLKVSGVTGMTAEEAIDEFGKQRGDNAVLNFGDGNRLVVVDTDLGSLADDLIV
ncbi:calcium-binding protein [Tropicimonas aquimaris]|uniref:Calcium-binding protein n=1 Tax=Tropicimonas aquimaris TaxID=914152 RepID=A0ABW3IJ51_9RHOB